MCLTTTDATIHVATEDILVYKSININNIENPNRSWLDRLLGKKKYIQEYNAFYNGMSYEIGKPSVQVPVSAFLSYISGIGHVYAVNFGYHSDTEKRWGTNAIFVIPKGTNYIKGFYNSEEDRKNYVSETITLKEILKTTI